jgi:hypothetical protein
MACAMGGLENVSPFLGMIMAFSGVERISQNDARDSGGESISHSLSADPESAPF